MSTTEPEPPVGAKRADYTGDVWTRFPEGWWLMTRAENASHIALTWEQVQAQGPLRKPRPGDVDRNPEPTPEEKYPEFCNLLGLNSRNMHTEETRVTSETGAAKGEKLARYDQIPTWPLFQLAAKYGKGNAKYPSVDGVDNWRKGYEFSKSYAALQRHANLFWSGEDIDPESGDHHLTAVIWHAMAMLEWQSHPELAEKYDDRQDKRDA